MKPLCWWLVLVALCLGSWPLSALAQKAADPPPPYAEFKFDGDPELLADRIKRAGQLEKAIKRMVDDVRQNPDKYQQLFKNLPRDFINDPDLKDRLREDPFVRDLIEKYKDSDKQALKNFLKKDKVELPNDPLDKSRPPNKQRPPKKNPRDNDPDKPPEGPKPDRAQTPAQQEQDQLARWTEDIMKRLDKSALGERLAKSAAWQKSMQSLEGMFSDKKFADLGLGQESIQQWSARFKLNENWPFKWSGNNPLPGHQGTLPALPRPNLAPLNPGGWLGFKPGPTPGSGGAFSPPGGVGATGLVFSQIVLWLGVIAGLIILAYVILRRHGFQLGRRGPGVAVPAGWPFPPQQITTRAELIATFEYLSLLLLGPGARTWNHKDIAAAVGDPARATPDQQHAADELAALYEQARYTPEEGPLTPAAVVAARRDLCLLAGVSNA